MPTTLSGLEKKQKLLLEYYHMIANLNKEKQAIGAKIKKANARFEQLLESDSDPDQLAMFENMDEFLTELAEVA